MLMIDDQFEPLADKIKASLAAINPEAPTFKNTIEALDFRMKNIITNILLISNNKNILICSLRNRTYLDIDNCTYLVSTS